MLGNAIAVVFSLIGCVAAQASLIERPTQASPKYFAEEELDLDEMHPRMLQTASELSYQNPNYFDVKPYAVSVVHGTDDYNAVEFVFQTSDREEYDQVDNDASMTITIDLMESKFMEAGDCSDIWLATGGMPGFLSCYFIGTRAVIRLVQNLKKNSKYSMIIMLQNPGVEMTAEQNGFYLGIEFYQSLLIEKSSASSNLLQVTLHASNPALLNRAPWDTAPPEALPPGRLTMLKWKQDTDQPIDTTPGRTMATTTVLALRWEGQIDAERDWFMEFYPMPLTKWSLTDEDGNLATGTETECPGKQGNEIKVECKLHICPGATGYNSNCFRMTIGAEKMDPNHASYPEAKFYFDFPNIDDSVNMKWIACAYSRRALLNGVAPDYDAQSCVYLDKPYVVRGTPVGAIVDWQLPAAAQQHWVTLEFKAGASILPIRPLKTSTVTYAGRVIITPPPNYGVAPGVQPRSIAGTNPLPGIWSVAKATATTPASWVCTVDTNSVYADTTYTVRLNVINSEYKGAALSWSIEVSDNQVPFAEILGTTDNVRGYAILGYMSTSVAAQNQLTLQKNLVEITFTPSTNLGVKPNGLLYITAPPGFFIAKRCPGFERIRMKECSCKGSDSNTAVLTFPEPNSVMAGEAYSFYMEVTNPGSVDTDDNVWTIQTARPDGLALDVANYDGFLLFPTAFEDFKIEPYQGSRMAGETLVVILFKPSEVINFDEFILLRAPNGVSWRSDENHGFVSSRDITGAEAIEISENGPQFSKSYPNEITLRLSSNLNAHFEYGFASIMTIPDETPVPNRYWLYTYAQTGNMADPIEYKAASGTGGFKTQKLTNCQLNANNLVEEAAQNPTVITIETTSPVNTVLSSYDSTKRMNTASIRLTAPQGFTYICPLVAVQPDLIPFGSQSIPNPEAAECRVDENAENVLNIHFSEGGLEEGKMYTFVVDLVNAKTIDPLYNVFTVETNQDYVEKERCTMPGFELAQRLENARYTPGSEGEDRRVDAPQNYVTMTIGTVMELDDGATLVVTAPQGFEFPANCLGKVSCMHEDCALITGWNALPAIDSCYAEDTMPNRIRIKVLGDWAPPADYYITMVVSNPAKTPTLNFWSFEVIDNMGQTQMAEANVRGFEIKEVHDVSITAYNRASMNIGEASPNPMDIRFRLTSRCPEHFGDDRMGSVLIIKAPSGFQFPRVCRMFDVNINDPDATALPEATDCSGHDRTLTLNLPPNSHLKPDINYAFRVLVENPGEAFTDATQSEYHWSIETRKTSEVEDRIDYKYDVVGFRVEERLPYFKPTVKSSVGLAVTMIRVQFQMNHELSPQKTIQVVAPEGYRFLGESVNQYGAIDPSISNIGALCDPTNNAVALLAEFPATLQADTTRLPSYISCKIVSDTEIVLKNEDPERGGRPLMNGPTYEFVVINTKNPQSTPQLNLWRITTNPDAGTGELQEVWAVDGQKIAPELVDTFVRTSNPGAGLRTEFTMAMTVITEVPEGGSIMIQSSAADYYFGPKLEDGLIHDHLSSIPPPSGGFVEMPMPNNDGSYDPIPVDITTPPDSDCVLEFRPCRDYDDYQQALINNPMMQTQDMTAERTSCNRLKSYCEDDINELFTSIAIDGGNKLELTLKTDVILPSQAEFRFNVEGYMTKYRPDDDDAPHYWKFSTHDLDSAKSILDQQEQVPPLTVLGTVLVDLISPEGTAVSLQNNKVTVNIRLSTKVDPKAILRVTYPATFAKDVAGSTDDKVVLGQMFPQKQSWRSVENVVTLEFSEEPLERDVTYTFVLTMTNPPISPPTDENVWAFETFTADEEPDSSIDANMDVPGFRIFGNFRTGSVQVTSSVFSPGVQAIIGVRFQLKSTLPGGGKMRIWMPEGFRAQQECGGDLFQRKYTMNRNPMSEAFPDMIYEAIPAGTSCTRYNDAQTGMWYVELRTQTRIEFGDDYSFEFGIYTADILPDPVLNEETGQMESTNVWRIETLLDGVVLHLERDIPGFDLAEIAVTNIIPGDTTTRITDNKIRFELMSHKLIPGSSTIQVTAPEGFSFKCQYKQVYGLSQTTTCSTKDNVISLDMDTLDELAPDTPFAFEVYTVNPSFTPNPNSWAIHLIDPISPSGAEAVAYIETKPRIDGFDITGQVVVGVESLFPYKGQRNLITIRFTPSTIMNQADTGNEIHIEAPRGYIFPPVCSGFNFAFANANPNDDDALYQRPTYIFPPLGTECKGYGNNEVTIRLPPEAGLLKNDYKLEVMVNNPSFSINTTAEAVWSVVTRINNDDKFVIVDANRTIATAIKLRELEVIQPDDPTLPGYVEAEGGASAWSLVVPSLAVFMMAFA